MRILTFSHLFPNPYDPIAGTFVLEQLKALRSLGLEVSVISPTPWAPRSFGFLPRVRKFFVVPKCAVVEGFATEYPRVPTLPNGIDFTLSGLLFYATCRATLASQLHRGKVDLIHAHTIMPDGFAAVLLGREFHLPVVCTAHGSDVRVYPFESRAVRIATNWALRRIGRLMTVSRELAERVCTLVGPRPVTVVHNAADPKVFHPRDKASARHHLGLPIEKKCICYVGYLRPGKGIEYLLRALPHLTTANVMLCLVGDGPLRTKLMVEAETLGVANMCLWAGRQNHNELPWWLAAADCMVLCSLSEGLPTVLPEAMLCGVPVVVTPVGGVPEIIVHRKTGLLVAPKDAVGLAGAIDSLLKDQQLASELANRAQVLAQSTLTWNANAEKTLAVYEDAVASYCGARSPSPARPFGHIASAETHK